MSTGSRLAAAALLLVALACSSGSSGRRFEGSGPVELRIACSASPGAGPQLEKVFLETFYPAISNQPGFKYAHLLRFPDREDQYVLTLAFESEDLRLRWAQSQLHEQVWPLMLEQFRGGKPGEIEAFGIVDAPVSAEINLEE